MKKDADKLFPKKMSKSLWCLKKSLIFATAFSEIHFEIKVLCGNSSVGRARPCKVGVAGSSPVLGTFYLVLQTCWRGGGMVDALL